MDEFTEMTGYHRKSAIRLLGCESRPEGAKRKLGRPRSYDDVVVSALYQVWTVADRICGKGRLQAWRSCRLRRGWPSS